MGIQVTLVQSTEIYSPIGHLFTKGNWVTKRQSDINMILIKILKCGQEKIHRTYFGDIFVP